ncbi:MAG: arginine--tRNA ligase [Mollicutes bacterium]|nr:arginine--tRNA ligase [Mollicutes bacterium]MDD7547127.1 arginine--tRNA ligase [Bacilli bacterium]MDY3761744.1 arginine--tRNA ligase [Candidatus Onthovivens sp.]MCI7040084.1 arginine--tRNA ligase [Mollicutes bacterium]MCI7527424.1 arginine--tRNA ligase [Mollicutes bacterium]
MDLVSNKIVTIIKSALKNVYNLENIDSLVMVEIPKLKDHGDFSSNIALRLAKVLKNSPINIANSLKSELENNDFIEKVEVVVPGFLNFFVKKDSLSEIINKIIDQGKDYGRNNFGKNEKVMVEYVSANPTGDLHLGHARGAAYGDSLTRVLKFSGYDCLREYYVNDAGNQIEVLGESLYQRYLEALGYEFDIDKIGYQGKDVKNIASKIAKDIKEKYVLDDSDDRKLYFKKVGRELELSKIKKDLDLYRVSFDHYQSELDLYKDGKVKNTLEALKNSGFTYDLDGALWLRTTDFGDDKDRVLIKSDGSYTYLLPDIAYHKDKFDRGYNHLINLFGADHHGYIIRLKAGLKILGYNSDNLDIQIVQMVRLMENGVELKMSKRTGNAITIRELCEDVGVDVARYFFISKPIVSHLDFDLDLARKHSSENPVYYIQYAYARCASILRRVKEVKKLETYSLLTNDKEVSILKELASFEQILVDICKYKEVNILCNYAYRLASLFHSYYNECKVIDETNSELTTERLALVKAIKITLENALNLLGIEVKEDM